MKQKLWGRLWLGALLLVACDDPDTLVLYGGTLVDHAGQPLPNARVVVSSRTWQGYAAGEDEPPLKVLDEQRTQQEGRYAFPLLAGVINPSYGGTEVVVAIGAEPGEPTASVSLAGKSTDLEIPGLLRWDEAFATERVDGGVLIHSEAPPPASPWTLPASGVDPDVFNHRGTEQTGFISRYHLELRTGGKTIWRQPLDGGTVALRDELLEDITDVSAFGALRGYGVAVGSGFNAPTATLIATASSRPAPVEAGAPRVPVSRGAACDWFKDGGTCPATDGILSAPEGSPPEWYFPEESLARSALTFQLTQPTALRSILIRGFEFFRRPEYTYAAESGALDQGTLPPVTLKVEGSTDGSVWSTVAVHTVPEGRHEFWYVSTLEYIFVELPVASTDTFTRVRLSLNSTDGAEPIRGLWELSLFQR